MKAGKYGPIILHHWDYGGVRAHKRGWGVTVRVRRWHFTLEISEEPWC